MIAPNEVAKGLVLDIEGELYLVIENQHMSKAGRANWIRVNTASGEYSGRV
jgi:translation elongation factor P/translation initiation factor 5A